MEINIIMKRIFLTALALTLSVFALRAEVRLTPLFSDNLILKQNSEAPIWGLAAPLSKVVVKPSWSRTAFETAADSKGEWRLSVKTPKGSFKSHTIEISDGDSSVLLRDVLIGEVWLCSGQSNMEMPVQGWAIPLNGEVIANSARDDSALRLLKVRKTIGMRPHGDFEAEGGGWTKPSPETVRDFSATAYFFGRCLAKALSVPVGLIDASWGGTPIEAWISRERLDEFPSKRVETAYVASLPEDRDSLLEVYNIASRDFDESIRQEDRGLSENWSAPSLDDSAWSAIEIPQIVQTIYPDDNGIFWFRKAVDIPADWEGKPLRLGLCSVDDIDDTYWNGELVGSGLGWQTPRVYEIPSGLVKEGRNVITVRNTDTGGSGGLWDKSEDLWIEGPDGSRVSLAGSWLVRQSVSLKTFNGTPVRIVDNPNLACVLYNGMIAPLAGYSLSGTIWYQGEANAGHPFEYRDLMEALILDWRKCWGDEIPFYITQLCGWQGVRELPSVSAWAELRESQAITSRTVSNTGLAVTIDIGEAGDIHPRTKPEVGRRLALAALEGTYGRKTVSSGPVFTSFKVEGSSVRLRFSSCAKGLEVIPTSESWAQIRYGDAALSSPLVQDDLGGKVVGFQIAGADHVFHWAEARVTGEDEITVSSPLVNTPTAVRYGWADNPVCNLYNSEGLPAAPFRTDDWTLIDQK